MVSLDALALENIDKLGRPHTKFELGTKYIEYPTQVFKIWSYN